MIRFPRLFIDFKLSAQRIGFVFRWHGRLSSAGGRGLARSKPISRSGATAREWGEVYNVQTVRDILSRTGNGYHASVVLPSGWARGAGRRASTRRGQDGSG